MNETLNVLEKEIRELAQHGGAGAKFPPNCFLAMKAEFVDYVSRQSLTVSFPVLEESLNPLQTMQGGFLTAAFDNVFGPLSYLAARCPCVTLTLNTQFIRSVGLGDRLKVCAKVVSRSLQVLHLSGEAFDSKNKLVALASATVTMAKPDQRKSP
jgi:uncharacterized protein (TIGR00369 family)